MLAQPTLLGYLIMYIRTGIAFDGGRDGYLYALGFALLNMARSLGQYNGLMNSMRTGIRVRKTHNGRLRAAWRYCVLREGGGGRS